MANMLNPQVARALKENPVTYVQINRAPARGPQPRLAQGSGRTAANTSLPGNAPVLPGYLTDNEYMPNVFDYIPTLRENFLSRVPRTIGVGTDGLAALNPTYKAHDFTPADRFFSHMRRAFAWQVMSYPPDTRNLLSHKQVERYQVFSNTLSARPLPKNNYFLGYQIDQETAADIGGQAQSYMGSF